MQGRSTKWTCSLWLKSCRKYSLFSYQFSFDGIWVEYCDISSHLLWTITFIKLPTYATFCRHPNIILWKLIFYFKTVYLLRDNHSILGIRSLKKQKLNACCRIANFEVSRLQEGLDFANSFHVLHFGHWYPIEKLWNCWNY